MISVGVIFYFFQLKKKKYMLSVLFVYIGQDGMDVWFHGNNIIFFSIEKEKHCRFFLTWQ